MADWMKLRKLYELKRVYRMATNDNRKESSAEHTWSCLVLADYFLDHMPDTIDRLRVLQILLYHDVVEIEAGDIPIHHDDKRLAKEENEKLGMHRLRSQLPKDMGNKIHTLWSEFEEGSSIEARFAKAIDKFDAEVHELDYKTDWKGWDEKMFRGYTEKHIAPFPELKEAFEQMIAYVNKHGYFAQ